MENQVQLITYPDSLGGDLKELEKNVSKHFKGAIGGIHILPFYPSSSDRGFAPLTHLKVDPEFGDWSDIRRLSKKYTIMADVMVNHISVKSKYFQDYLKNGSKSKYADYFITNDKFSRRILSRRKKRYVFLEFIEKIINKFRDSDRVFHSSGVSRASLRKIYRPREESPFVPFTLPNGEVEYLWCTFTREQVDMDVYNDGVRDLLKSYIAKLSRNGVHMVRLDAVGYLVKKRNTSSFMLPETLCFVNWLGRILHKNGMLALPEIHHHYSHQIRLSRLNKIDYVYDFQLPVLVLYAIYNHDFMALKNWLNIRPNKAVTTLDTHDGLPIIDLEDLLSDEKIKETSEKIISNGGNETRRASGDNGLDNVDTYQINCTYYSALNENDDDYIVARAIQFFVPGVPQVYYDGLLAGKNDVEKINKTNVGRDIMRHDYTDEEISSAVKKDVVKRLLKLMRFRNNYPIFDGDFSVAESDKRSLILRWRKGKLFLEANIDLNNKKVTVNYLDPNSKKEKIVNF